MEELGQKQFNVSFEISTYAKTPIEAAKWTQTVVRDRSVSPQFYVQDNKTKEIFSVDLSESDEDSVLPVKEYKSVINNGEIARLELLLEVSFVIICWPESQDLMEQEGFRDNATLINDDEGLDIYGSSAYYVNSKWLSDLDKSKWLSDLNK